MQHDTNDVKLIGQEIVEWMETRELNPLIFILHGAYIRFKVIGGQGEWNWGWDGGELLNDGLVDFAGERNALFITLKLAN